MLEGWSEPQCKSFYICFCSGPLCAEDLKETLDNETLKRRWVKAVQIKGTLSYHAFLPDEEKGYMKVKHYALSSEYKKVKVLKI